ncbi:SHK1 protein [Pelomyxa schiedti]|nr:SHK1 protein [Pelomyxa schiedti]
MSGPRSAKSVSASGSLSSSSSSSSCGNSSSCSIVSNGDIAAISSGPPNIAADDLVLHREIHTGGHTSVWVGLCRNQQVVIKLVNRPETEDDGAVELAFENEIKILSKVAHKHICQYLGACISGPNMAIVMEYLHKHDLESLLHKEELSLLQRMRMASDAVRGLVWLHNSNPAVLHRNLTPSSMLVDEHNMVKLGGFGASTFKHIGNEYIYFEKEYIAPEVLLGGQFTPKADIYSFGICLWAIFTKKKPYTTENHTSQGTASLGERVIAGERPATDNICPQSLASLMKLCWDADPGTRPDAETVLLKLEDVCVDCVVSDPWGKTFWLLLLKGKDNIPWDDFTKVFLKFTRSHSGMTAPTLECLRILLTNEHGNVSLESWGRMLSVFGPGNDGRLLQRVNQLCQQPYFHGYISTDDAISKLCPLDGHGHFLVRISQQPGCLTFSYKKEDTTVQHFRVSIYGGKLSHRDVTYDSVTHLINELCGILRFPCTGSMFTTIFSKTNAILTHQYQVALAQSHAPPTISTTPTTPPPNNP